MLSLWPWNQEETFIKKCAYKAPRGQKIILQYFSVYFKCIQVEKISNVVWVLKRQKCGYFTMHLYLFF